MITPALKRTVLLGATSPPVSRLLRVLGRGTLTIFMLHRLKDASRGVHGHAPDLLRDILARMQREEVRFLSLMEAWEEFVVGEGSGTRPPAVAFTLDDGYLEQVVTAGEIFGAYRCPATVFLPTGFLDGKVWLWWDQIDHLIQRTSRPAVTIAGVRMPLGSPRQRLQFAVDYVHGLKKRDFRGIRSAIEDLATLLDVELPARAPDRYVPATWDQVREAESPGWLNFAPHTVHHPILARESDQDARHEIEESWRRVQGEVTNPCPIFAYPNGMAGDFGAREMGIARKAGLAGAVSAEEGVLRGGRRRGTIDSFRVPRFALPDDVPRALAPTLGLRSGGRT